MKKIAFFLNQPDIHENDLSDLLNKSYKIGGSGYEILLVSYMLERRDNGIRPYLLSNYKGKVPHQASHFVQDLKDACDFCTANSIKSMVVDFLQFKEEIIEEYSGKLDFYVWAHNIMGEYYLNSCLTHSCVKKIICVSQSEMLNFRKHPSFLKACYIYNIILFKDKEYYRRRIGTRNQHNVVFMGCIRPDKGFHVLAQAWPNVLVEVPDAQLYVIGNAQLYGKDVVLGKYGVAEPEYEDEFMPYLTDDKGEILPSVHFMGLLGEEKYDILGKCKVGVPNPTDSSETFCISGVEMELMGCSVTTLRLPVFEETQMNKDYLFEGEAKISNYVVRRLKAEPDNHDDLYEFVTTKFGAENSLRRWEELITSGDVEQINKIARIWRNLRILIAKYHFLIFTRAYNFLQYRIKHHLFRKA